jgi:hypothetical protein
MLLGEGWGGLGEHGEWERVVKAFYGGEEISSGFNYAIWFDDSPPAGAVLFPDTDGWNWVATNPAPYFGKYAHQSPTKAGTHQHFFQNATQTFAIGTGDVLYCFVYLDPVSPPTEVMLQFAIGGDFEHRAYWGANSILLGVDGQNSRRNMGALPATGQWVRLDVPASQVGLEGQTINGMAFTLFGGQATWDQVGKWKSTFDSSSRYLFRPGVIVPSVADIQHAGIQSLPSGTGLSGSANIFVRLSAAHSAEDHPDRFRLIFEARKTYDFDATGEIAGYNYSTNPARVAADRILAFFERAYRNNQQLAREKFRARVDWVSWRRWRDYNEELIPWDKNGTGSNVFIKRFEAHPVFDAETSLADALDRICSLAGAWWQDDGEQLRFVPPTDQTPIHHFDESNITSPPRLTLQDLRERPNYWVARFRDLDDEFLGEATIEVKRDEAIDRVGENRVARSLPTMTQSQAQRLAERWARVEHDNDVFITLAGAATSIDVLPGDFVTVSHPVMGWDHQLCLVTAIAVRSGEESADEVDFTLQQISGPLYSDTAHTPRQSALALP